MDRIKPTHDNVPISPMMHKIILKLEKEAYYYVKSPDEIVDNPELIHWMKVYAVVSLIYIRLNDQEGEMAAMLNLHFTWKDPLNTEHINRLLQEKKKIESIFNKTVLKQY